MRISLGVIAAVLLTMGTFMALAWPIQENSDLSASVRPAGAIIVAQSAPCPNDRCPR